MKKIIIKAFILVIVLYALLSIFYRQKLPDIKESIFWVQSQQMFGLKFIHDLSLAYSIVQQNETARLNKQDLSSQEAALKQLSTALWHENRRFQEAAGFVGRSQLRLIPAQIISRSPDSWYSFVIINKGFQDKIRMHDPVIVADGLVGEVVEVFTRHARVSLLTDRSFRISCEDISTNEVAVAEGRIFDLLALNYVPANSLVQVGDPLLTSGYSQKYPKGLQVGHISSVQQHQGEIFKTVAVKPSVNFSKLDIVFVLKD